MQRRIRILMAAALIGTPFGLVFLQRQIASTPASPVSKYVPIQPVSKQLVFEPDIERRKREQFEETSRFFDSPGLSPGSGTFGGR